MKPKRSKRASESGPKPRTKTPGQKVATALIKQCGDDSIYIGPWLLFRRVVGENDTKHAVGWIKETIAEEVDNEFAKLKEGQRDREKGHY